MDRQYLIALYSFNDFGPIRTKLLVDYFGSSEKAWKVTESDLIEIGLSRDLAKKFTTYRDKFEFDKFFNKLEKLDISIVTINDSDYPKNLIGLDDAPMVLYVRGKLSKSDENAIAVVGSRKMTSYGREVAERIATELSNIGITIISGLAFGIDLEAHKAAVNVGGKCIAVLASGIDQITPRSNEWLGLKVIENGGAVISEYPPGIAAQKYHFPYRNRIISGLSKAVIVVEGMIQSGTIHTANHAAAQGKVVFAVPGSIFSPQSAAPFYLIKNGAKILTSVEDVLEELNMQVKVDIDVVNKVMPTDELEEQLVKALALEELYIDELSRMLGLKANEISAKLTVMQIKGLVVDLGSGKYRKI